MKTIWNKHILQELQYYCRTICCSAVPKPQLQPVGRWSELSLKAAANILTLRNRVHLFGRPFHFVEMSLTTMSSPQQLNFIQRISKDGTPEWMVEPEDYDYHQEIARAAYADMLHDHDRNIKYYNAIKIAIKLRHAANKKAIVLDIGTGTGLLSMMALSAGADIVYACEAFHPMSICADSVLKRNNYRDKVHLIPKRSTELQIGKDLSCRANILVAEVFDTELIGEGAIEVFNHAKRELVTDDCIVIPNSATVSAQVVHCPLVANWNKLNDFDVAPKGKICFPKNIRTCPGVPSVHDLQLSEIKEQEFTKIGEEITVFTFNWDQIQSHSRTSEHLLKSVIDAPATAVFMWWDLNMDPLGESIISCRPSWAGVSAWRDHWMQAVYYLPDSLEITAGTEYKLKCSHDEFSFWFKVTKADSASDIEPHHPVCTCGVHLSLSRSRIGILNNEETRNKFIQNLESSIIPGQSVVLVISEGSWLGLLASKLGARSVFILDQDPGSAKITKRFMEHNAINGKVIQKSPSDFKPDDFDGLKVDLIIGDPYFHAPIHPWNHIMQWQDTINALSWSFSSKPIFLPSSAQIKCVAVNFEHFWKIRAPVGVVCEFDLSDFDTLIEKSSEFADSTVDSQPLWEYPGTACSPEIILESCDFSKPGESQNNLEDVKHISYEGKPNGLAFWVDWKLGSDTLSTGPVDKIKIGEVIKWDRNWKQGVYLFRGNQITNLADWWRKARHS